MNRNPAWLRRPEGALSLILGRWVAYAYLPLGGFVVWVVLLNMAQGRIRELVNQRG